MAFAYQVLGIEPAAGVEFKPELVGADRPIEQPADQREQPEGGITGLAVDGFADDLTDIARGDFCDWPLSPARDEHRPEVALHHSGGAQLLPVDIRDELFGGGGECVFLLAQFRMSFRFFGSGGIAALADHRVPFACLVASLLKGEGTVFAKGASRWVRGASRWVCTAGIACD